MLGKQKGRNTVVLEKTEGRLFALALLISIPTCLKINIKTSTMTAQSSDDESFKQLAKGHLSQQVKQMLKLYIQFNTKLY